MKKYIGLSLVIVLLLLGGAVFAIREITYAQYTGAEISAQHALDTTPLAKIAEVTPYTGGFNGFLITGHDELGRDLYVWAADEKVVATQYADQGMTREQAIEASKQPVWAERLVRETMREQALQPVAEVVQALPGPVLANSKVEYRTAPSRHVWEIYGRFANGTPGYTYLDFKTGQVLWQIALPEQNQDAK
ncbi:hypothetical protein OS242_01855 [Tumebacillus sp. DT12]|uniref:PepSY domain-containing protein n=1 Tax=Tumebacillus lacus TaxID=2995335 RepID=A0ABT3X1Y2_9BACL|nr:hypothetical protein [Tumebacillus lacus]MCX7568714.1 hypothetical protein [Tumebacillus lacus]